ncbi:MAG: redox-regulated ATPase YchF, partial [Planctomycetes bacterium]|nr:redox-regulated ATPase YchF [Planctomycetota bacterium]
DFLTALHKPKKTTHATLELLDLPGFSPNDAHGRDALTKALPSMRQCDVLIAVVRDFESDAVPAYRDRVDAQADLAELAEELVYADLLTTTNRLERLAASMKKPTGSHDQEKRELALLESCKALLEESKPLSDLAQADEVAERLSSFGFLTLKPLVVVYNVDESRGSEKPPESPTQAHEAVCLCAETEAEIAELDPTDRPEFLADLGVTEAASARLIHTCYRSAETISFFTVGPDEVRAWPVHNGATAQEAAGKIHSDLARGFIRAETVAYDVIHELGDMKEAKAAGKVRQEGKTYIVQDGDILLIKFNV